ncbi:MAG: beta-ketoacyl-ACP synthase II [Chloroflexi bacterium]|nr:beta-ketoacyl-ACP synthase II [Chloroflexota bacterium]
MHERIVITGLGCVSPLGNDAETTWNQIVAGISGAARITLYDPSEFLNQIAAEVKDFDAASIFGRKAARRMDRFSQFALLSAQEAVEDSGLKITSDNRDRIGAVIGSAIGGLGTLQTQFEVLHNSGPKRVSPFLVPLMLADSAGGMVAIHFGIRGPNLAVVTACATGTNSIGEAAEIIRRGQADVMLAGGTEAAIVPIATAGLATMTALTTRNAEPERASRPFDKERDGFLMGEGAAVLVLESLPHAEARGANILGEIVGYGVTNDAHHISAPAQNGAGAALCMQMALDNANLKVTDINYINAHGTSTPLNDKSETAAIKTVFGEHAYAIPVSSTKSMTGHMLGASGAMEALFCIKAMQDEILPPTINYENPDPECDLDYVPNEARPQKSKYVMSNSFGFGGHNATLILKSSQGAPV